jgi:2-hydroxy-6-oxonona-2,4-dienedioate hydrolase
LDFQYLDIDNLFVRYHDTQSKGNPVLLLHGLGGSIESWLKNISAISAEELRVIVLDLPGFGLSDKPKINYTINFYTIFIAKFIKSLKIDSCLSIVGCSLGGQIAAEIAIKYPTLSSKLVLISPAGAPPYSFKGTYALRKYIGVTRARSVQEVKEALSVVDNNNNIINNTYAQDFYHKLSTPGAKEAFISALKGSADAPRLSKRLDRIQANTLLIWGKNDQIIPVKYIEPFIKMKNCRIILIENSGHVPFINKPQLFNKIVTAFIKE